MDQAFLDVIRLKVGALRVPEAKEVLEHLKLPRTGRKDELIGRILTIFQDAANLTAQGHQLRDQGRVDAAAAMVDSVFQRAVRAEYMPAVAAATRLRQQYPNAAGGRGADGAAAAAAAAGGGGGGGGGGGAAGGGGGAADADAAQPNKRLRLTPNGLLPQHQPFRVPSGGGGAGSGRGAAAAAAGGGSDVEEVITAFMNGDEGVGLLNTRVRCVCSDHNPREPMLQCEGAFCGVWQHAGCVKQQLLHSQLQPLPVGSDKWPKRRQFFCERCRVARADPFWEVYDALVMPPQQGRPTTGRLQVILVNMQPAEWTVSNTGPGKVTLTSNQIRLLREAPHEYQLQAMSVCLDDAVQFRMQWPTAPMLKFGPHRLRVAPRANGIFLGPMQRDAPANLTPLLNLQNVHGVTVSSDLCLEYADPKHSVLLLAYIMRRRTREQVKALMKPPEPLAAAVQRVRQCMNPQRGTSSSNKPSSSAAAAAAAAAGAAGGGSGQQQQQPPPPPSQPAAAADDADIVIDDDDDDDDIAFGNRVVSLKDPNTFSRIRTPARFTDTVGSDLMAFDLDAFLDLAESTRKWCDPHSNKASTIQCLQVDSYLAHILSCLAQQPDVLEVEVNEEAAWRPAGSSAAFRPVLDAAGAPVVPGAAAWGAAVAGAGGGGGGAGGGGDSSDEEDEAAELRRAVSEVRRKQQEVIEILDSDEEEDGGQGAAAAAAGGGGTTAAQPQQRQRQQQQQPVGLRIQLPSRIQQQQQHLQQHQQQAASANMAAAAVGPHVGPHLTPGSGSGVVGGGGMRIPGVGGSSGVMSPRVVTGNPQQQQQQFQQQMQPPPLQHQHQQQQQQQLPGMPPLRMGSGDVLLQQQLSNNPPMQQHQHMQQPYQAPPQQQYPHMQPLQQQQHGGLPQGLQLQQQQPPQQQQQGGGGVGGVGGQPINTGLLCMGGQYYLPVANGGPVGMVAQGVAPPPPPGVAPVGGLPAMGVPHMQQQQPGVHQGGSGMLQHQPLHHHSQQQQGQQFPPPQGVYSQHQQQQPPPLQYQQQHQQHQPPPGPPYRYC